MPTKFYIGLVLSIIGGIGLDSKGKALYVVYCLIVIGAVMMISGLIQYYRAEQNRRDREMQRTIDRYLRDYRGM